MHPSQQAVQPLDFETDWLSSRSCNLCATRGVGQIWTLLTCYIAVAYELLPVRKASFSANWREVVSADVFTIRALLQMMLRKRLVHFISKLFLESSRKG